MRKVELTLPELAAVSAMVEQELQRACYTRAKAKATLCWVNVAYWTQRVAMLRQLKAKLEREDAEDKNGL